MSQEQTLSTSDVAAAMSQLSERSREIREDFVNASNFEPLPESGNENIETSHLILSAFASKQPKSSERIMYLSNSASKDFFG